MVDDASILGVTILYQRGLAGRSHMGIAVAVAAVAVAVACRRWRTVAGGRYRSSRQDPVWWVRIVRTY